MEFPFAAALALVPFSDLLLDDGGRLTVEEFLLERAVPLMFVDAKLGFFDREFRTFGEARNPRIQALD